MNKVVERKCESKLWWICCKSRKFVGYNVAKVKTTMEGGTRLSKISALIGNTRKKLSKKESRELASLKVKVRYQC